MFVKVYVLESCFPMPLGNVGGSVRSFYVVTSKQVYLLTRVEHSFIIIVSVVSHVRTCDCDVSFLISVLVRLRAACTMRGLALYLGGLLLWCCQFGVVILQCMGIVHHLDSRCQRSYTRA